MLKPLLPGPSPASLEVLNHVATPLLLVNHVREEVLFVNQAAAQYFKNDQQLKSFVNQVIKEAARNAREITIDMNGPNGVNSSRVALRNYDGPDSGMIMATLLSPVCDTHMADAFHFQEAVKSASIVSRADIKGTITYINDNFVAISGYTRDELLGQNHNLINSGFHPRSFWTGMWRTISQGNTWRAEVKNKAKDGSFYWVDTFIMPFKDDKGTIVEYLSIRNDITARKSAEERLQKNIDQLSETLHFGKMGSAELDLVTHQMEISPELSQLLDEPNLAVTKETKLDTFLENHFQKEDHPLIRQAVKEHTEKSKVSKAEMSIELVMFTSLRRQTIMEVKSIFHRGKALLIFQDISYRKLQEAEKKKFENTIRETQEFLSHLISNLPGYVYEISLDTSTPAYVSDQIYEITGYHAEEFVSGELHLDDLLHPVDREQVLEAIRISTIQKTFFESEYRILTKSGQHKWIWNKGKALYTGDGNPSVFIGFAKDVTDRKSAELALDESRSRFHNLIHDLNIGVMLMGPKSETFLVNKAACNILGVTEDQLLGRTAYNVSTNVIKEDGSEMQPHEFPVPVALATGKASQNVVMGVYKPDQDLSWIMCDAIPIYDAEGKILHVISTFTDITERKKTEVEVQRLSLVASSTHNGVILTNEKNLITWANKGFEKLTGYSLKELFHQPALRLLDGADANKRTLEVLNQSRDQLKSATAEVVLYNKDSKQIWTDLEMIPLSDSAGKMTGWMYVLSDITELKKSIDHANRLLFEKEYLIREIHHRVKNNLQMMSSVLFLKAQTLKDHAMRELLSESRKRLRSMALIHERLMQAGAHDAITDAASYMRELIDEQQQALGVNTDLVKIVTDIENIPMGLEQLVNIGFILNETITNALKYAFPYHRQGIIEISLKKAGEKTVLRIADNGVGLPPDVHLENGELFGVQLVKVFAGYFGADVKLNNNDGTEWVVTF